MKVVLRKFLNKFHLKIWKLKTLRRILLVENLNLQNLFFQLMLKDNTIWLREIGCLMKFLEELNQKVELLLNTTDKKFVQNSDLTSFKQELMKNWNYYNSQKFRATCQSWKCFGMDQKKALLPSNYPMLKLMQMSLKD